MNILIIGNGFDIEHKKIINFKDFVQDPIFQKEMKTHYKFFTPNSKKLYYSYFPKTELWSDFEEYCLKITEKNQQMNKGQFYKKISFAFSKWITKKHNSNPTNKSKTIENILKNKNINFIISFNFTHTPKIYDFVEKHFSYNNLMKEWKDITKWEKKYLLIHYFPSKETIGKCVIGHDNEKKYNKNWEIEDWGIKNKKINYKTKIFETILEAINQNKINSISFFGFSFGNSDTNIIEKILKNNDFQFTVYHLKNNIPKNIKNLKNINFIEI